MRKKIIHINDIEFPSIRAAARYIVECEPGKKEDTIVKELRTIFTTARKPWTMYGKYKVSKRKYEKVPVKAGKIVTSRYPLDGRPLELYEFQLKLANILYYYDSRSDELVFNRLDYEKVKGIIDGKI